MHTYYVSLELHYNKCKGTYYLCTIYKVYIYILHILYKYFIIYTIYNTHTYIYTPTTFYNVWPQMTLVNIHFLHKNVEWINSFIQ